MDAQQFLTALWGESPPAHILIWTLPEKLSTWLTTPSDIVSVDITLNDVYMGVALGAKPDRGADRQRIRAANAQYLAGLWADIDYADSVHTKPNLPPTEDAAIELVRALDVEPTIIVSSGHGLQCWWLFPTAWDIREHETRQHAMRLAEIHNIWLNRVASERGWVVDSVHDLARVMRLAGTINYKDPNRPEDVNVLGVSPRRYEPEWWDKYLSGKGDEGVRVAGKPSATPVTRLSLDPRSTLSYERLEGLFQAFPEAKSAFEHTKRIHDESLSGYDMALANYAAQARWTDEDVSTLLMMHRRKWNGDLKLRDDYYQRTISKARVSVADTSSDFTDSDAGNALGYPIKAIYRLADDDEETGAFADSRMYMIWGEDDQVVRLPGIGHITNQSMFRNAVADITGKYIQPQSATTWHKIAEKLIHMTETIFPGDERHPGRRGQPEERVDEFLRSTGYADLDDGDYSPEQLRVTLHSRQPFRYQQAIYIYSEGFQTWMEGNGRKMTFKEIGVYLRNAGWKQARPSVGGIVPRPRVWTQSP